jgi:hypothetical protein
VATKGVLDTYQIPSRRIRVLYVATIDGIFQLEPQCQWSHALTRISAAQLKKVVRRKEPVCLIRLSQMGGDGNPAENSQLPNAWECILNEFEDVVPTDQPCEGYSGLVPRRYCKDTLPRVQRLIESGGL